MKYLASLFLVLALAFPADARMKSIDGKLIPLTATEEVQRDVEEATYLKVREVEAESRRRIRLIVPAWSTEADIQNMLGSRAAIKILGTTNQKRALLIFDYIEAMKRKLLKMTPTAIAGVNPVANDPFGDGMVWP